MDDKRTSGVWVAVAGLLLVPVGMYVGAYFLRGEMVDHPSARFRVFRTELEKKVFSPAAKVEAFAIGKKVETDTPKAAVSNGSGFVDQIEY